MRIFIITIYCMFLGSLLYAEELLNERLDRAVIQVESSGDPNAFNKSSQAVGLMQITPIVLKEYNHLVGKIAFYSQFGHSGDEVFEHRLLNMADLYNPQINLKIGDWYLNERIPQLLKHYHIEDNMANELWAYNAGIGKVKEKIIPKETRIYIEKVIKLYQKGE